MSRGANIVAQQHLAEHINNGDVTSRLGADPTGR
jgi:hypothetical protein